MKFLMFLFISCICSTNLFCQDYSNYVKEKQEGIYNIQKKAKYPETDKDYFEFMRSFDLNEYFKVLSRLKMQDGYNLKFVFTGDGLGSFPLLLTIEDENLKDFNRLTLDSTEVPKDSVEYFKTCSFKFMKSGCDDPEKLQSFQAAEYIGFLNKIKVENTPEAYLEYTILAIIGSQYCLRWHAAYHDREIITSYEYAKNNIKVMSGFSPSDLEKIQKIDFKPTVKIDDNEIDVRLVVFTKWGGFIELIYKLETENGVVELDKIKEKTLFDYDCGITF